MFVVLVLAFFSPFIVFIALQYVWMLGRALLRPVSKEWR